MMTEIPMNESCFPLQNESISTHLDGGDRAKAQAHSGSSKMKQPGGNIGESRLDKGTVRSRHNVKRITDERVIEDEILVSKERLPLSFHFRRNRVPVTYHSSLAYDDILIAVSSRPFQVWIEKASRIFGSKCIQLHGVHIENVHFVDDRVDCINMHVDSDLIDDEVETGNVKIGGSCCLRDSTVGIFIELHCVEDNTVWSILVDQPRINVGAVSALELPVALIDDDGETLIGQQVQEIENSCDISLTQSKMVNLTQRAYETNFVNNSSGLCPSLGNCSEFITIMHLRKELTNYQLVKIRSNLSRTRWDGAPMSLRVMPLGDIWKVSADMKVICALFLMERAGLPEKSQKTVENEQNREGEHLGVGMRGKLNKFLSFSKIPSMFGQH